MKKLSDIIKEANDIKTYLAKCTIDMEVVTSSTDITNAGEEVTSMLDEIEGILNNYGFKVNATHMTEIDLAEFNERKINESVESTDADIDEPSAQILNDTPEQVLTAQVVDIFDVVESRISKVKDENVRNRMIEMLINKISKINEEQYNVFTDTAYKLLGISDEWTVKDIQEHLVWLINNPDEIAEGYDKSVFTRENIEPIMDEVKRLI